MKSFYDENKKAILVLITLIIMMFIFFIIGTFAKEDNRNKYIENKGYVFTIDSKNNSKLPYINLNSKNVDDINDSLQQLYYEVITEDKDNFFSYEYSIDDDILSVLIKYDVKQNEVIENYYLSYNIDINNFTVYSMNDIFAKFGIDKNSVEDTIINALNSQYDLEISNGQIEPYCDQQCFLDIKGYESIDKNANLYIKKGKLYAYINLIKGTIYYDENNNKYSDMNVIFELN